MICSYVGLDKAQAKKHKPELVYLDDSNNIVKKTATIAMQVV